MTQSKSRGWPALDGLRALAILGVLLVHLQLPYTWTHGTGIGVLVFFTLSGFLITSLLLSDTLLDDLWVSCVVHGGDDLQGRPGGLPFLVGDESVTTS